MGKRTFYIFYLFVSHTFSLICLYRNRDILVNVLKRNSGDGGEWKETQAQCTGEHHNIKSSYAALSRLFLYVA